MTEYCYYCMNKKENNGICESCGHQFEADTNAYHLPAGTVLNEKYLLGRVIGEGGFGITYIGRDLKLDMIVAVKEFYPTGYVHRNNELTLNVSVNGERNEAFFSERKEKYIHEARILAKFSGNKSIVDVRDFFECNNTAYIVMEYIQGETLTSYIKNNGIFTATDLIQKMLPIFEALKLIHKNGLIHRDISPDNIMMLQDGSLKLMDFGAAREVNFEDEKSLSIVLKRGYAPEEQYRSKGKQGPWTDIYAACATIYKCITGVTPDESTERVYSDELKPPSYYGIDIPASYEKALMKGLAVYQKDRYQTVDELIAAFYISESDGVSTISVTDLSNSSDSDDITEYYEENEETDEKTVKLSEDKSSEAVVADDSYKAENESTDINSKRRKTIKRFILISIPSFFVVCGLIIVLIILSSKNNSNQNMAANTTDKEAISQQANDSDTENGSNYTSGFAEETLNSQTSGDSGSISQNSEIDSAYSGLNYENLNDIVIISNKQELHDFSKEYKDLKNTEVIVTDCHFEKETEYRITYDHEDYLDVTCPSGLDVSKSFNNRVDLVLFANEGRLDLIYSDGYDSVLYNVDEVAKFNEQDIPGKTGKIIHANIQKDSELDAYWIYLPDANNYFGLISTKLDLSQYEGKTIDLKFVNDNTVSREENPFISNPDFNLKSDTCWNIYSVDKVYSD